MHVTVTQRGGYVGHEVTLVHLDTGRLGTEIRRTLEQDVEAAIASLATRDRPVGADLLEYRLVVDDQGRHDALTWIDDGGPSVAPMRDLVARLQEVQ